MNIQFEHDTADRRVSMGTTSESISDHVDMFRRFLIAVGFHQKTIDEYVPDPASEWDYSPQEKLDRG